MAGRPLSAVPNIFASEGTGLLNNIPLLDADFATLCSFFSDSAIGYVNYGVDTGLANAYVVTLAEPPSAYEAGTTIVVKIANTNTAASSINVNSVGSVAIVNPAGVALQGGELSANAVVPMVFDGTSFRIIGDCPLNVSYSALTGVQSVNCAGATSIFVQGVWNSGSMNFALQNVSYGVPITLAYYNFTGAAVGVRLAISDPAGNVFTLVRAYQSGVAGGVAFNANFIQSGSGILLGNNLGYVFTGKTLESLAALFSY
jgi:hypothetical protein